MDTIATPVNEFAGINLDETFVRHLNTLVDGQVRSVPVTVTVLAFTTELINVWTGQPMGSGVTFVANVPGRGERFATLTVDEFRNHWM